MVSKPTFETCRQLFGDLVRAAVAVQDVERNPFFAEEDSHGHSHGSSSHGHSHGSSAAGTTTAPATVAPGSSSHGHSHGSSAAAGGSSSHGHSHGSSAAAGGSSSHGHSHGSSATGGTDSHGHSHSEDGAHGHSHGCASMEGEYQVGLHIAAIFIILVASLLGTLIPLLGKRVPALRLPSYVYAVGKATATGVVLAVSMIHMINHAAVVFAAECIPESFAEMYEGWAFLFAMIAAILMHAIDGSVAWVAERWSTRAAERELENSASGMTEPCNDKLDKADGGAVEATVAVKAGTVEHEHHGAECQGHQHGVVVPSDMPLVQRVVAAVCMEFGVTLHSVFVGLALAVSNGSDLRALIIALVFHQLFEGLAMGARLADASFRLSLEIVLMLVFSFSAPIGIAAGTAAVSASHDAFSGTTYAIVSAVLDAICGGIMLYIAFNLLFVDFPFDIRMHCGPTSRYAVAKRIGLYAGLWVGAGVMAGIGKWL